MTTALKISPDRRATRGTAISRPAWKISKRLPRQGQWTEDAYIRLTDEGHKVEFVKGFLEFSEMPSLLHDRIAMNLVFLLHAFVTPKGLGEIFVGTTKTKVAEKEIRMPDVMFVCNARRETETKDYFYGADLVMEVVSPDPGSRKRDLIDKKRSYARAGISEYWIVDPKAADITVLKLDGKKYSLFGRFESGQKARSALLKGFEVEVSAVLQEGKK